jgi:hypothetical protein
VCRLCGVQLSAYCEGRIQVQHRSMPVCVCVCVCVYVRACVHVGVWLTSDSSG